MQLRCSCGSGPAGSGPARSKVGLRRKPPRVTRRCGVRDERTPQHHDQGEGPALAALCVGGLFMAALALGIEAFLRAENFSVGAVASKTTVRGITVSPEA